MRLHVHAHVHVTLHRETRDGTMLPVMSERCQCRHDSKRRRIDREIATLFALVVLLMAFAIAAGLLGQQGLAVIAGTACVSLAGRIARRLTYRGRTREV